MDVATLIGFVCAVAVVLVAILMGDDIGSIINVPSMLIVLGGSCGVVLMRYSIGSFFGAAKIALKAFFNKSEKMEDVINQGMEIAELARKDGVLALENVDIKNRFFKQGIQSVVDGLDADVIEEVMMKDIAMTVERHTRGQQIFKVVGDVAPAMGMIGTLIGLVQMLSNLSDPSSLGPAMAVAMLTTLYGAMLANLVALPIAEKLELRSQEERTIKTLIMEIVLSVQSGQNPRVLNDVLKANLPFSQREKAAAKAK